MDVAYILDSYALAFIAETVPSGNLHSTLHLLTDLAHEGALVSPESVWRECLEFADRAGVGVWAKAVSGHFAVTIPSYEYEEKVLNIAPDLVDFDSTDPQTQVDVATLAYYLQQVGRQVYVVTEDSRDRPDRMNLSAACAQLSLTVMSTVEMLSNLQ